MVVLGFYGAAPVRPRAGKAKIEKNREQALGPWSLASAAVPNRRRLRRSERDLVMGREVLGLGVSGQIRRAQWRGAAVAVKSIWTGELSERSRALARNEADLHLTLDHPHVVRLEQAYESEFEMCLVMECLEGGDLFDRLAEGGRFSEDNAAHALRQMVLSLSYLHGRGIAHCDIKPENFCFESAGSQHLKLIDFGFAQRFARKEKLRETVGTLIYSAPEVLIGSYTEKADLWSLGVLAFTLLCGIPPWSSDELQTRRMIEAGAPHYWPHLFEPLSQDARHFVGALMEKDPARRLSAKTALEHAWLRPQAQSVAAPLADGRLMRGLRVFADASPVRRACLSMVAWSLPPNDEVHIRELFLSMAGPRGTISMRSLARALEEVGHVSAAEAARTLEAESADASVEISYREFAAASFAGDGVMAPKALQMAFDRFDADRSEVVGKEDGKGDWEPTCFEEFVACCKGVDEALLENQSPQLKRLISPSAVSTVDNLCEVGRVSSCCSEGSWSDSER